MQLALFDTNSGPARRAISPYRELGAYEALWLREGTSFKSIAEMFRRSPDSIPSTFVEEEESLEAAREAVELTHRGGADHFDVRIHGAGEYPSRLRDALHPVELLYFQGIWALTETRCVSVVGTRRPSEDGCKRATQLSKQLIEHGFTVVSGLAAGIDTVAHRSAIESGGRTIAVLGTPISTAYPKANAELQHRIAQKWLVISQVPICRYARQGPKGNRLFFPERNATMAALSEATIIVEASDTSGTLIQARAAIHQRRKLFILDSCFRQAGLTWPERFARQGATRVRGFEEILEVLNARPDAN